MSDELQPPQTQTQQPGIEAEMQPKPQYLKPTYTGSNKLLNKVAIITGGDSGIGRAIAVHYAIEGAKVVIVYLNEDNDAEETKRIIEERNGECLALAANLQEYAECEKVISDTLQKFNQIDILINNIAEQHPIENFEDISCEQWEETFKTNVFSYFSMIKLALPHLPEGGIIINTTSITAYRGSNRLIDYSASRGAIVSLTRSLSQNLITKKIRVNAVAPGPIWTPLIPASFSADEVANFGKQVPMKRPGQPSEVAPCYVFLASEDSSYMSGQVLHPNGGAIVES